MNLDPKLTTKVNEPPLYANLRSIFRAAPLAELRRSRAVFAREAERNGLWTIAAKLLEEELTRRSSVAYLRRTPNPVACAHADPPMPVVQEQHERDDHPGSGPPFEGLRPLCPGLGPGDPSGSGDSGLLLRDANH